MGAPLKIISGDYPTLSKQNAGINHCFHFKNISVWIGDKKRFLLEFGSLESTVWLVEVLEFTAFYSLFQGTETRSQACVHQNVEHLHYPYQRHGEHPVGALHFGEV